MKIFFMLWFCGYLYSFGDFLDNFDYLKKLKNKEIKDELLDNIISDYDLNILTDNKNIFFALIILLFVWPYYLYTNN